MTLLPSYIFKVIECCCCKSMVAHRTKKKHKQILQRKKQSNAKICIFSTNSTQQFSHIRAYPRCKTSLFKTSLTPIFGPGSFSTVSVWPSLNHKTARVIQKAETLFFMVGFIKPPKFLSGSLDVYSKVMYTIALAWVVMACSSKEVVETSLGISLLLASLLLFTIGCVSTSLILYFL